MDPIQRPATAPPSIFWRPPPGPIPAGTPLAVGPTECAVVVFGGAVLGLLAPGSYTLHPQALPFLAPSLDAASNVTAELWFVFTGDFRGCKFGGPLGRQLDPVLRVEATPLVMGEYSMKVIDPPAFVRAHASMPDGGMVVASVSGEVLRKTKELCDRVVAEGHGLLSALAGQGAIEKLRATLGDLRSVGLAVDVQSLNVSFSDDDRKVLVAASAEKAKAMRAVKIAELQAQEAASSPTGGALFVAPAAPGAAAPPPPPGKRNSGLIVGPLVAGLVLAAVVGVAVHHSHAEAAPQHHGKR